MTHEGENSNSGSLFFMPERARMPVHLSRPHRHGGTSMLTDYAARCPHEGCGFRGYLFPQGNRDAFRAVGQTRRDVTFLCPRCARTWRAQIVGEDAVNLPLTEVAPTA